MATEWAHEPRGERLTSRLCFAAIVIVLVLAPFVARVEIAKTRTFDPDEFEHLHAAWSFSRGELPYRDFFEHHPPGLYVLLRPLFSWYDVATSPDRAVESIFFARRIMWALSVVIVGLTYVLGWLHGGVRVGGIAAVLLSTSLIFVGRTLEIRPDVPSTLCWVASLVTLTAAVGCAPGSRAVTWRFLAAGALLGTALLFSQKLLMAGPGMAAAMAWYTLDRRFPGTLPWRFRNVVVQALGVALPIGVTFVYFAAESSLYPFIHSTLLVNLGWQREVSIREALLWFALRDPYLAALGSIGLLYVGSHMFERRRLLRAHFLLFATSMSLAVGLFIIPVPNPNYMQTLLPLAAVCGALFLVEMADRLTELLRRQAVRGMAAFLEPAVLLLVLAVALALVLSVAKPRAFSDGFYPLLAVGAMSAFVALLVWRANAAALGVILLFLSVYSFQQLTWMAGLSNTWQIEAIREVQTRTRPQDQVLDGWSGVGVYRPHAWYTSSCTQASAG